MHHPRARPPSALQARPEINRGRLAVAKDQRTHEIIVGYRPAETPLCAPLFAKCSPEGAAHHVSLRVPPGGLVVLGLHTVTPSALGWILGAATALMAVRAIGRVLSLGDWVEDRFDVEDRSVVNRFEAADEEPQAVDGHDLDSVEADRVGPVG